MEKDGHGLQFVMTAQVCDQRFIELMAVIACYHCGGHELGLRTACRPVCRILPTTTCWSAVARCAAPRIPAGEEGGRKAPPVSAVRQAEPVVPTGVLQGAGTPQPVPSADQVGIEGGVPQRLKCVPYRGAVAGILARQPGGDDECPGAGQQPELMLALPAPLPAQDPAPAQSAPAVPAQPRRSGSAVTSRDETCAGGGDQRQGSPACT